YQQMIDTMSVMKRQSILFRRIPGPVGERLGHPGAGSPGDMKAGHGIAVAEGGPAAALGPPDHRSQFHAELPQPAAFLAGGELDIGPAPSRSPFIFGARPLKSVPSGAALPVTPGQVEAVSHAQTPLFRRVDQE